MSPSAASSPPTLAKLGGPKATPPRPTPSDSLMQQLARQFMAHLPFSGMALDDVVALIAQASEVYFAPAEVVLSPESGTVNFLYLIRQGEVSGRKGMADLTATGFHYEAGDLFPVAAAMAARAVTATYTAQSDTFALQIPWVSVEAVAARSPALAQHLTRQTLHLVNLSRRAMQAAYSAQALAEHSLERKLRDVSRKQPITCAPDTPLSQVLQTMHERRIGSVIVVGSDGTLQGIFTRQDVLGRVALPQTPLSTPISQVMNQPVHWLSTEHTAEDATLLMSRHGIRHVPVLENGVLVSLISERDLYAIQRTSLKQVSGAARAAADLPALQQVAAQIRSFARTLMSQGVQAKSLTELISHLNDVLTARLVQLKAQAHGLSLSQCCWLSFGSEGRAEQTISTDQDNGLIFELQGDDLEAERQRWLAFANDVNHALDACGYPLCKGFIMASNPECCLTPTEWRQRFAQWIDHGTPENLLRANIYFDFRALAGEAALADSLRQDITRQAMANSRFHKQLADDILRRGAPLNWLGAVETEAVGAQQTVDLKLRGTALFVDVARLRCLALGIAETNTRRRLEAVAEKMGADPRRREAWVQAFEFLQMLRLRVQIDGEASPGHVPGHANKIELAALNEIDRRLLKESLRVAQRLQKQVELDYAA